MHTKHLSYEDTVKKLKELEFEQATDKDLRNHHFKSKEGFGSAYQKRVLKNKEDINLLLSLIKIYKESRKMFAKLNGWGPGKDDVDISK